MNWVIGVPGETDADVEEGINFFLENREYIGRLVNINPLMMFNGGVYWLEPEKHNIHFRKPKEEIYWKHPRAIPAYLWYSTEPYIDERVRQQRFNRIVLALHNANVDVGPWAARVIDDVKYGRDDVRVGVGEGVLSQYFEGGQIAPVAAPTACETAAGESANDLVSIQP